MAATTATATAEELRAELEEAAIDLQTWRQCLVISGADMHARAEAQGRFDRALWAALCGPDAL